MLAALMLLGLTACGSNNIESDDDVESIDATLSNNELSSNAITGNDNTSSEQYVSINVDDFIDKDKDVIFNTFDEGYNVEYYGPYDTQISVTTTTNFSVASFHVDYITNKIIGCEFDNENYFALDLKYGMEYDEAKPVIQKLASDIYEYENNIYAVTNDNKYLIVSSFEGPGVQFSDGNRLSMLSIYKNTDDLSFFIENYYMPFAVFGNFLEFVEVIDKENQEIDEFFYTEYKYRTTDNTVNVTLGKSVTISGDCKYNIFGAKTGMDVTTAKETISKYGYDFGNALTATTEFGIITIEVDSDNIVTSITLDRYFKN